MVSFSEIDVVSCPSSAPTCVGVAGLERVEKLEGFLRKWGGGGSSSIVSSEIELVELVGGARVRS